MDAEHIVDTALKKDSAAARQLYLNIQHRMKRLHQSMSGQAFDERRSRELIMAYSWMRIIAMDMQQQAWVGTAIAANQLTASIIRFTHYPGLLQRDTAWMHYLARELLLLSMEDAKANAQLLDARRANLEETWSRIKKALITADFRHKPLLLRGDQLVRRLRNQPQTTTASARQLLGFMSEVEQLK